MKSQLTAALAAIGLAGVGLVGVADAAPTPARAAASAAPPLTHARYVEDSGARVDALRAAGTGFVVFLYEPKPATTTACGTANATAVAACRWDATTAWLEPLTALMDTNHVTVYGLDAITAGGTVVATLTTPGPRRANAAGGYDVPPQEPPLVAYIDPAGTVHQVGSADLEVLRNVVAEAPGYVEAGPVTVPGVVDRSSKAAVNRAYAKLVKAEAVRVAWTGRVRGCKAGALTAKAQRATFTAINVYRSLAGVAPVTEAKAQSKRAQKAALIMQARGDLSHTPPATWPCYTAAGAAAAGQSNLALGSSGAAAMAAYMNDAGTHNTAVGHRRWLLNPSTATMGSGSTAAANALWVWDIDNPTIPAPASVAWPSAGYFPAQVLPSSRRWSYTFTVADFTNVAVGEIDLNSAKVTVTRGGKKLKVTHLVRDDGAGQMPALVWQMPHVRTPAKGKVDSYTVRISGVYRRVAQPYTETFGDGTVPWTRTVSGREGAGYVLPAPGQTPTCAPWLVKGPVPAGEATADLPAGTIACNARVTVVRDPDVVYTVKVFRAAG
jgi:uncharacterized protein YkwD